MALETVSQKFGLIFGSLEEPVSGPSISAKWTWTIIWLSRNRVRLDLAALTVEPKLAEKFQLLLDLTRGMLFLRQNLARQERRLKTGDVTGFNTLMTSPKLIHCGEKIFRFSVRH